MTNKGILLIPSAAASHPKSSEKHNAASQQVNLVNPAPTSPENHRQSADQPTYLRRPSRTEEQAAAAMAPWLRVLLYFADTVVGLQAKS